MPNCRHRNRNMLNTLLNKIDHLSKSKTFDHYC